MLHSVLRHRSMPVLYPREEGKEDGLGLYACMCVYVRFIVRIRMECGVPGWQHGPLHKITGVDGSSSLHANLSALFTKEKYRL